MFLKLLFLEKDTMLYVEGNLCTEDRAIRRIARSKVNTSLQTLERKTALLVDLFIGNLDAKTETRFTIDSLLETLFSHPQLKAETATIKHYSDAFPELKEAIEDKHERITLRARTRIENALFPFKQARRFRFTRGFRAA